MEWIKTEKRKPPQATKIIAFNKGDISVVQRFGKYYFPIPFTDSEFATIDPPEFWSEIDFPEGFTGKVRFALGGKLIDGDECERDYPQYYKEFCKMVYDAWQEHHKK